MTLSIHYSVFSFGTAMLSHKSIGGLPYGAVIFLKCFHRWLEEFMRQLAVVILLSTISLPDFCSAQRNPQNDQPARIFTLEQAINYALTNSFSIKSIGLSLESARQNLIARKGAFRLNVDASLQSPNFAETFDAERDPGALNRYFSRSSILYQGNLNINQPLPTNGVFSLTTRVYRDLTSVLRSETELKQVEFLTAVGLRFRQPLFTINTLKLGLEQANLNFDRSNLQLQRTELDVIFTVTQVFYNLYRATRELEIRQEELKQQQEAYDLASKKFSAGLIPEVEALQTEVDLAQSRNRTFTAETALRRQADFFKQTIGLPLQERVSVQAEIRFAPFEIDLNKAIEFALARRSEIREALIDTGLREIEVKQTDARSEFRADISAFYDLRGVSDPTLPTSTGPYDLFKSSWDDLQDRPRNKGINLLFSMPLWDSGVNRAEVEAAHARLDQAQLNLENERMTVEREIKDVVSRVLEARSRLEVLGKSQNVAGRSYEISLARFDNGDITTQELALDRDRLTRARSAFLQAYIDYQVAVADLKRKTLYDFEKNVSLVKE
jgi:outer membrane protein TolC